MSAPPTGKLARTAVGGMALAQAGAARIGRQARKLTLADGRQADAQHKFEADIGRIIFAALNQLKGTALKLSQLLSAHADFLPEGVRAQLAKGCYQVTPLNRALVHKVFRQQFDQAPESLFASFEHDAFAAASLGQVHRATLVDGTPVAVKVQYPGIGASIKSDIRMLRVMLQTIGLGADLLPRKELMDRVMDEVAHKLAEELDYEHEAAALAWFRERTTLPGIVIPRPIPSHSSERVLTMERLDGMHLDQWLATSPSQEQRDRVGQLLFDWFWYSLFELGRIHADPHQGNFLVMRDGQVGLLDFGCTKSIFPGFCQSLSKAWAAYLSAPQDGSREALRQAYLELGLIAPDLSQADFDDKLMPAIAPLSAWQLAPFRLGKFNFGAMGAMPRPDPEHTRAINKYTVGMHDDLPYFNRALLGMMQLLQKLSANIVTENRWINPQGKATS